VLDSEDEEVSAHHIPLKSSLVHKHAPYAHTPYAYVPYAYAPYARRFAHI
jgi:hypothetical protein